MKTVTLFILTFLTYIAHAQTWQWVKNPFGSGGVDYGEGIVIDEFGNSYIRGCFYTDSLHFGNNITLFNSERCIC